MRNSMWKLIALAGVVALGFFAVLQTQRGLQTDQTDDETDPANTVVEKSGDGKSKEPPNSATLVAPSQFEPSTLGGSDFGAPGKITPISATNIRSGAFPSEANSGKTEAKSLPEKKDDGNPFNDFGAPATRGGNSAPSVPGSAASTATKSDTEIKDGFKSAGPTTPETKTPDETPSFDFGAPGVGTPKEEPKTVENKSPANSGGESGNPFGAPDPKATPDTGTTSPKQPVVTGSPFGPETSPPFDPGASGQPKSTPMPAAKSPEITGSPFDEPKTTAPAAKSAPGPAFGDPDKSVSSPGSPMPKSNPIDTATPPKSKEVPTGPFGSPIVKKEEPKVGNETPAVPAGKIDDVNNPFGGPAKQPADNSTTNTTPPKSPTKTETLPDLSGPFGAEPKTNSEAPVEKTPVKEPAKKKAEGNATPVLEFGGPLPKEETKEAPKDNKTQAFPGAPTPEKTIPATNAKTDPKTGTPPRLILTPEATPLTGAEKTPTPAKTETKTPVVQSQPKLTIEKTAPKNAVLGQPFVYDIIVKNNGNSPAHQVTVDDPIPSGVRLEGSDPQAVLSGRTLKWKLGTLDPGKSTKISVKVTPVRAGQIGSIATVNFVAAAATTPKPANAAPKLTFDLIGPEKANVGDKVKFTFKVQNVGNGEAKDVWIRDIIPAGLKHPAGDDLEYKVGTLGPGKTEEISLTMTVAKAGSLTNRAIVSAAGGVRVESRAIVAVNGPHMVITRSGPNKRYIGTPAVYQNMITNDSPQSVSGATVTEIVPAGMEFVEASDGGKYDPVRRVVAWNLGALPAKQSKTVQLKLLPKATGTQQSIVKAVAADGTIVQTASATKIEGYAIVGVEVPAINRPVSVGEQVTFRIVGRNRGTAASANVRLQVTLPAQLDLVGVRGQGKYATAGRTITFEPVSSLAANGQVAFDLTLKATAAGDSRVKVSIQSDEMSKPLSREDAVLVLSPTP